MLSSLLVEVWMVSRVSICLLHLYYFQYVTAYFANRSLRVCCQYRAWRCQSLASPRSAMPFRAPRRCVLSPARCLAVPATRAALDFLLTFRSAIVSLSVSHLRLAPNAVIKNDFAMTQFPLWQHFLAYLDDNKWFSKKWKLCHTVREGFFLFSSSKLAFLLRSLVALRVWLVNIIW